MENLGDVAFDIKPIIEQTPFENPAVQSFFGEWCRINDGIEPEFVDRKDWEEHGGVSKVLVDKPDGKKALFIPKDLQLWEMVGVMEAVDNDTFANDPDKRTSNKDKLMNLGHRFENAAIYITKRLEGIGDGKQIAEELAKDFYKYGTSLTDRQKLDIEIPLDSISLQALSTDETRAVDKWLAGDDLYASRIRHVPKNAEGEIDLQQEESQRQNTLAQFFRVSEKAFERKQRWEYEGKSPDRTGLKPWESGNPLHEGFINKINKKMAKAIEAPRREMEGSIFRRGLELLQRNMPTDSLPEDIKERVLLWREGEETLREALGIDRLKEDMRSTRERGDLKEIAHKEKVIAHNIQKAVSNYPHAYGANNPSEMISDQELNCVGASMLSGALLSEVGINYLVGELPGHSILFLVTSAGRDVEYMDMLAPWRNHELTDDVISGKKKDGSKITVEDIAAFSKNPKGGLGFNLASDEYADYINLQKKRHPSIIVYGHEYGHSIQVLNNVGHQFAKDNKFAEATEAFQQTIAFGAESPIICLNLATSLSELNRNEEAVDVFRKAISLNPEYELAHLRLGNVLAKLGRDKEALKVYEKFIQLADSERDQALLGQANAKIVELKAA